MRRAHFQAYDGIDRAYEVRLIFAYFPGSFLIYHNGSAIRTEIVNDVPSLTLVPFVRRSQEGIHQYLKYKGNLLTIILSLSTNSALHDNGHLRMQGNFCTWPILICRHAHTPCRELEGSALWNLSKPEYLLLRITCEQRPVLEEDSTRLPLSDNCSRW